MVQQQLYSNFMTHTVAEIAIHSLIKNKIEYLYCLPGVQNDPFFDTLYDHTDKITPIVARHEQGAAYMATGASLATGNVKVFCVVPGPGFLNTTAALSTAFGVNAQVLGIIGQIPVDAIGKGHGLLHEIPNQLEILSSLTKFANRITSGLNAREVLDQAFNSMQTGRPQPSGIEIPMDVWNNIVQGNEASETRSSHIPVDLDQIDQAKEILSRAKTPMIVVGSGAQKHSLLIRRLVDMLAAPILSYRNGQGVVPANHPLKINLPVGYDLWRDVDVVLGLGTRLQSQVYDWGQDGDLKIIHIDIDKTQLNRSAKTDVAIHADLEHALPELIKALEGHEIKREDWIRKVKETSARRWKEIRQKLTPQIAYLKAIRENLPKEGIFVDELTQVGYVSRFAYQTYLPRTYISTGYQGTLGYGFPTALGVAHERRDVPVVTISGDGGALVGLSELATAVKYNIPLTTIVFNDNAYGNVQHFQRDEYDGRIIATDLTSPDFVKYAEAFGVRGMRTQSPTGLKKLLKEAINHDGPCIIEVEVGVFPSPWEFLVFPKARGECKS